MYPITPATSASHYLSDVFEKVGGIVHQAEDEISACAFAIGASYAGKCAVTITSGPGFSLKQEAMGLAVMAEIPLVVVNVQRGGPSTGLPTKAEQGDLLSAIYGGHGDAPKVVMAASTIEDCFYSIITARKIAETFNMVVVVLSDAGLATSQQPFPRPTVQRDLGGAAGRPERYSSGGSALRLERDDRSRPSIHPRSTQRHARRDRTGPRSSESRCLRSRNQRGKPACAQSQARDAAEDAHAARGLRRPYRRPVAHRLGKLQRGDRGSSRDHARGRRPGLIDAPADSCNRCHPASKQIMQRFAR